MITNPCSCCLHIREPIQTERNGSKQKNSGGSWDFPTATIYMYAFSGPKVRVFECGCCLSQMMVIKLHDRICCGVSQTHNLRSEKLNEMFKTFVG